MVLSLFRPVCVRPLGCVLYGHCVFVFSFLCESEWGTADGGTVVKALCYKSEGSIPDGVIGIFHWRNSSDRTMALGSTQPLTEMSTRRISCG
jgi:hypothetical protein